MTPKPTVQPISFVADDVRAVRAGKKTEVRRPFGRLGACRPGHRLWIREPFHLERRFEQLSPLQVVQLEGSVAAYAADILFEPAGVSILDPALGRCRFAREMPKVFHRSHLIVHEVRREPLQSIDERGARAEGVRDGAAFIAHWNAQQPGGQSISGAPSRWSDNPMVDVIAFSFVDAPLVVAFAFPETTA